MNTLSRAIALIYENKHRQFSELPEDIQTPEVVMLWLRMHDDSLREIPAHLVSDDVRRYAVQQCAVNIRHIRAKDTAIYRDLFLRATRGVGVEMGHIDAEAIGPRDMGLWIASRPSLEDDFVRVRRWNSADDRDLYYQEMFAVTPIMISFGDMLKMPDSIVLEGAKSYGIVAKVLIILEAQKRTETLRKLSELENWTIMKKPQNLDEAASHFLDGVKPNEMLLLKPFIRSFPIADVCQVMSHSVCQQEALVNLYSEEELKPLYSDLQHTKKRLLEISLDL
jgi:hypothetical protein